MEGNDGCRPRSGASLTAHVPRSHETEKRHGAGKGNWGNEDDDITACAS